MRANIRPTPTTLAPKPPPPPLLPLLLLFLPLPAVGSRIPLANWSADDNRMPVVSGRRAHEAEPVQPRGYHIIRRAEEDGRRP